MSAALEYLHQQQLIHRDIKPSNIQVLPSGHCKLMDFGIARAPAGKITATGMVMGTPGYMAPEIVEDAQYSTRADLYSAALVMYEMLAGHAPFVGDSTQPEPLARPDAQAELAALVLSCIANEPAQRPASAEAILASLEAISLKQGSLAARPPRRALPRS